MATLEKQNHLSDSHWYTRDGQPAYTIKKKDGGDRPATLRDARKHNLLPSVTTIFNIMAKPQLDKWKLGKAVEAALTTSRDEDEPDDRYHARIIERSRSEVTDAAKLGTRIHDAIEAAFGGQEPPKDLAPYVNPTVEYLKGLPLAEEKLEQVVVNPKMGYAGRVDFIAKFGMSSTVCIDFKTRKTKEGEKVTPYDLQAMQIAAYSMAAFNRSDHAYGMNIYISTTEPGRMDRVVYEPNTLKKEYEAFKHMCALWRYYKNYDPRS